MRFLTALTTSAMLVAAMPALAQQGGDLTKCLAIARESERLACYDAAASAANPAARAALEARKKEAARIAAEEAAAAAAAAKARNEAAAAAAVKARKEAFGIEGIAKRPDRFKPKPGEITEVEARVTDTLVNRLGFTVFGLDNNQVWRQADLVIIPAVRTGDKVRIKRALLGGFDMTVVRLQRVIKVKRIK